MTAMTLPSLRAVVMFGDPDQLLPTIVSEMATNEGALYIKRPLMERLFQAGYPSTMLNCSYRSHPDILDFYNREVYGNKLKAHSSTREPNRVGNVWDRFTSTTVRFHKETLERLRRIFISVPGLAVKLGNSTSWSNQFQVNAAIDSAQQLYKFVSPQGERIEPKDLMFLSPYKDQVRLLQQEAAIRDVTYCDNLTVDAAQGQEAPVVFYMLTKPSQNWKSVGFLADRDRINVALSRAKQVLVIFGNTEIWNSQNRIYLRKTSKPCPKLLLDLLDDVIKKRHVVHWSGLTPKVQLPVRSQSTSHPAPTASGTSERRVVHRPAVVNKQGIEQMRNEQSENPEDENMESEAEQAGSMEIDDDDQDQELPSEKRNRATADPLAETMLHKRPDLTSNKESRHWSKMKYIMSHLQSCRDEVEENREIINQLPEKGQDADADAERDRRRQRMSLVKQEMITYFDRAIIKVGEDLEEGNC